MNKITLLYTPSSPKYKITINIYFGPNNKILIYFVSYICPSFPKIPLCLLFIISIYPLKCGFQQLECSHYKKILNGVYKKNQTKKVEPDYGISYNQLPKITHHLFVQISKHILSKKTQQAYNQFKSAFKLNQMKSQFDSPLPLTRVNIYTLCLIHPYK